MNPADFIIPSPHTFRVEAFVIAKNKAESDLTFSGNVGNNHSIMKKLTSNTIGKMSHVIQKVQESEVLSTVIQTTSAAVHLVNVLGKHEHEHESENLEVTLSPNEAIPDLSLLNAHEEVLHNLETEHFARNYYLRPAAAKLSEVTIKTNVMSEFPFINNHLIIAGKRMDNLYDLIRPLRAKYIGPMRFIVILCPKNIEYDAWFKISAFEGVLFIKGYLLNISDNYYLPNRSPTEENNLRRAGIFRASKVIVLADGSVENGKSKVGQEALVDSDAIFTYQCVKRMNPNSQVVVEIVNQSNIAYLETENTENSDYKFSPQFASGVLFNTALLDSLVCQVL